MTDEQVIFFVSNYKLMGDIEEDWKGFVWLFFEIWLYVFQNNYIYYYRADKQQKVVDLRNSNEINESSYDEILHDRDNTFIVLVVLLLIEHVLQVGKYYALFWFCRNASMKLHKKMLLTIIGANMDFFDTHYFGNILNRLSFDLNSIDETIPSQFPSLANVSIQYVGFQVIYLFKCNGFKT